MTDVEAPSSGSAAGQEVLPGWVVAAGAIGLLGYLAGSIEGHPHNFSVFLFDYEFGVIRRGLLGELIRFLPAAWEDYVIYLAIHGIAGVALYVVVLTTIRWTFFKDGWPVALAPYLVVLFILVHPLFFKNLLFDFGRFDMVGFLALFSFALASLPVQRVLIVLLPPVLILCHEAQLVLTVAPMLAIFLIAVAHADAPFRRRNLAAFGVAVCGTVAVTTYLAQHLVPPVPMETFAAHIASKSAFHSFDASYVMYLDATENIGFTVGGRNLLLQLQSVPIYILTFVLNLPLTVLLWRFFKRTDHPDLRQAAALILVVLLGQCVLFVVGLDYARWIADIFVAFLAMFLFLVRRFDLADDVVAQASRHRNHFLALIFLFLMIPEYGIVASGRLFH